MWELANAGVPGCPHGPTAVLDRESGPCPAEDGLSKSKRGFRGLVIVSRSGGYLRDMFLANPPFEDNSFLR